MTVSVGLYIVLPRKLAAVRRAVAPGEVGSVWGPAVGKVWNFIRSQPGLWSDGHNIFVYHLPNEPGATILCDFGVEVTRTFETAGEVYATETPSGEAAVAVHRGPYDRLSWSSRFPDSRPSSAPSTNNCTPTLTRQAACRSGACGPDSDPPSSPTGGRAGYTVISTVPHSPDYGQGICTGPEVAE